MIRIKESYEKCPNISSDFYDVCIACGAFGDRTIKAARIKDMLEFVKCGGFMAIVSASYAFQTPYKGRNWKLISFSLFKREKLNQNSIYVVVR